MRNNVFSNNSARRGLLIYKDISYLPVYDGAGGISWGVTTITQNTFCGTPRDVCNRDNQSQCGAGVGWTNLSITNNNGLNWSGSGNINLTGAPQGDCDGEVDRIIQEMAELPGLPSNPPATPCN